MEGYNVLIALKNAEKLKMLLALENAEKEIKILRAEKEESKYLRFLKQEEDEKNKIEELIAFKEFKEMKALKEKKDREDLIMLRNKENRYREQLDKRYEDNIMFALSNNRYGLLNLTQRYIPEKRFSNTSNKIFELNGVPHIKIDGNLYKL